MEPSSKAPGKRRVYYGWVIVLVIGLTGFTQSAETFPVLGVFLKPITEEFGWSRAVFTGSMTVGTLLGGFLAIGTGPLVDRFGARWPLVGALGIVGASLVLMVKITALWQFYVLQVTARLMMMGVVGLSISVIIPKWFVSKRGRAVAIGGLGSRVGNTVTPLYVQALVSAGSWRLASATAGIIIWVVSMLPAAIFLRRRPEDMGLLPDGTSPQESSTDPASATGVSGRSATDQDVALSLRQVVRLPSFYLLLAAFALVFMAFPSLHLHMISFLTDRGLSAQLGVTVVAVMSATGALGALVFGLMAERYGSRLTMALVFLLMSAAFPLFLAVQSSVQALAWGVYYGFLGGGMFTLQQVIFADYFGRQSLGAVRGVVAPVQMGANAVGPLFAALAFDASGDYNVIFSAYGAFTLLASVFVFLARPPVRSAQPPPSDPAVGAVESSAT